MAAKDMFTLVEIPWIKGSSLKMRPFTMAEERKLLASASEGDAYLELVESCVESVSGFTFERDYGAPEHAYLLSKLRQITYGDDMALSGFKCPHCGHVNSNHLVRISEYKIYDTKKPIMYELQHSDLGKDKIEISFPTMYKAREINRLVNKIENPAEKNASFYELQLLSIFSDYTLAEAQELSYSGKLDLRDIKMAQYHLLKNNYGYDYSSTMICHKKDCRKEFDISLSVVGPGFLVPYIPDNGRDSSEG